MTGPSGFHDSPLLDEEESGLACHSDGLDGCYLIILLVILGGIYAWLS